MWLWVINLLYIIRTPKIESRFNFRILKGYQEDKQNRLHGHVFNISFFLDITVGLWLVRILNLNVTVTSNNMYRDSRDFAIELDKKKSLKLIERRT